MSRNELFQSRSVCALLLVCISLCPSVFAGDYSSSSWRGFDSSAPATEISNPASQSSSDNLCSSFLTLVKVSPAADQKGTLHLDTAGACQTFCGSGILLTCKSKTPTATLDVSFVDGRGLTVTDVSAFEKLLPANILWTLGQYEVMWSFVNSSAEKIASAQNARTDKQLLHVLGIADSAAPGLLASGTGLFKQI